MLASAHTPLGIALVVVIVVLLLVGTGRGRVLVRAWWPKREDGRGQRSERCSDVGSQADNPNMRAARVPASPQRRLWVRLGVLFASSSILVGFFELAAFASGDSDPEANERVSGASWIALGISIVAGLAAYLLMRGADRPRTRAAASGATMTIASWLAPIAVVLVVGLAAGQI